MATKNEKEELAVLKEQMKTAKDDIKEIKQDVKAGFENMSKKLDDLPNVFITRREGNVLRAMIVILIAAVSAIASILLVTKK